MCGLPELALAAQVGGTFLGGMSDSSAAAQSANAYARQSAQHMVHGSVEEQRTRAKMRSATRTQASELAGRGIDLGSPTAIYLGQQAGAEMAFAGASVRQNAVADAQEADATAQMYRAKSRQNFLTGSLGAAGTLLTGAPQVWPELLK